jgi:hypothetical protein
MNVGRKDMSQQMSFEDHRLPFGGLEDHTMTKKAQAGRDCCSVQMATIELKQVGAFVAKLMMPPVLGVKENVWKWFVGLQMVVFL